MDELRFFKPRAVKKYQGPPQPPPDIQSNDYIQFRYKYNSVEYGDLFSDYKNKLKIVKHVAENQDSDRLKDTITYWQYQVINLSLMYNPYKIMAFADIYMHYGCWVVLVSYMILSFVLAMPLYFLFFFMGYYSKQKYMTFWLALPLLKGIGFAIALVNILQVFFNMAISSLSLYLSINWLIDSSNYCERPVANPECVYIDFHKNCTGRKTFMEAKPKFLFPSLNLLNDIIFDLDGRFSLNFYWILSNTLLWLVILLQLLHKPTMNVFMKLNGIMWIFIILVSLISVFFFKKEMIPLKVLHVSYEEVQDITFWSKMFVLVCQEVMPGDILTYATKIKKEVKPTVEALIMFVLRCLVMIIVTNWIVFATIGLVQKFYLIDTFCLRPDGINTMFAMLPELFKNYPNISKLSLPMYFLLICFWSLMSAFYSINGFLEALHSQMPKISKFKYLCLGITWVFLILNIVLLNNNFKYFYHYHRHARLYALYLMMCVALFITLYTPRRVVNDYQFTFGIRIGSFWRELLKFYAIMVFIAGTSYSIFVFREVRVKVLIYDMVLLSLTLAPILFCVVAKTISYKTHKSKYLIKPDFNWGPPSEEMREARRNFNAKLRLNESMVCNHDCVLHSPFLDAEITKWFNREKYFDEWYHSYTKSLQSKKKLKRF